MSANNTRKRKLEDRISEDDIADTTQPQAKKLKLNSILTLDDNQNSPKNNQNNESLKENTGGQLELPPEILLTIFCQLSRADLVIAGAVCQHWWLVSKDESLTWCSIKNFQFTEDGYSYTYYGNSSKSMDLG